MVEGAGGVMVPLNETETMLNLMKALGLPGGAGGALRAGDDKPHLALRLKGPGGPPV